MDNKSTSIIEETQRFLKETNSLKELQLLKPKILGKKSKIRLLLKNLSQEKNIEKRKIEGEKVNKIKLTLEDLFRKKEEDLIKISYSKELNETIDISLKKAYPISIGRIHPISLAIQKIYSIFHGLGFQFFQGPEIETEYYNFEALNIPEHHPARNDHDSFYLGSGKLLRTQCSPIQIRVLEKWKKPISIISTGRCFRKDNADATHSHTFHQLEGLVIDKKLSLSHLKGILDKFSMLFFQKKLKSRFKKDFFPFTRPSLEYSIECFFCTTEKSERCKICKGSKWIEIAGAGLVHTNILDNMKIDSKKFSGFAFGFGIERLVMIQYQIDDIRLLYENNVNFLEQFL